MGLQLRWLERTPDKREVGGSSPPKPTIIFMMKGLRVTNPDFKCTLKTEQCKEKIIKLKDEIESNRKIANSKFNTK